MRQDKQSEDEDKGEQRDDLTGSYTQAALYMQRYPCFSRQIYIIMVLNLKC